ncbi:hypothetical protein ACHAQH_000118 [Verticillium albo-atrum]
MGYMPDSIDDSLFVGSPSPNVQQEIYLPQPIIHEPNTYDNQIQSGNSQSDDSAGEAKANENHDSNPTVEDTDKSSKNITATLEVANSHRDSILRDGWQGWSFFDEATASTGLVSEGAADDGNADEADALLALAFTEADRTGAYGK